MENIFLARQPIYDRELNVSFYEILYRSDDKKTTSGVGIADGDRATSQVLLNLFGEMGIETVTDNLPAFINLTRNLLLGNFASVFSKDKVVIEILENTKVDQQLIDTVLKLKEEGFLIALDDFVFQTSWLPLIEIADFIKIDVYKMSMAEVKDTLAKLKPYKARLLAEKIETHEMFQICVDLKFEYFQGYFLCKPNTIVGHHLPANKIVLLNLLAKLQNTDTSTEEISNLLSQDTALSLKILRILNSAMYALARKIDSLNEAVVMLGRMKICSLANMILLTSVSDKPNELTAIALTRAKQCELLAQKVNSPAESGFIVGLFSTLDAMLDQPMAKVLIQIPLADDLVKALLKHQGPLGGVLKNILHYERGDWDKLNLGQISIQDLQESYVAAIQWTQSTFHILGDEGT